MVMKRLLQEARLSVLIYIPALTSGCQVWMVKEWVSEPTGNNIRTSDIQKELRVEPKSHGHLCVEVQYSDHVQL